MKAVRAEIDDSSLFAIVLGKARLKEHSDPSRPDYGLLHPGGGGAASYGLIRPPSGSSEEPEETQDVGGALEEQALSEAPSEEDSEAATLKHSIVSAIAQEAGVDYETVNTIIKQWAYSANDGDMRSLALQRDISRELGVPLSPWQKGRIASILKARKSRTEWYRGKAERVSKQVAHIEELIDRGTRKEVIEGEFPLGGTVQVLPMETRIAVAAAPEKSWRAVAKKAVAEKAKVLTRSYQDQAKELPPHLTRLAPAPVQRKVIRAVYNRTQKRLKALGIEHVTLARGTTVPRVTGERRVNLSAATSWTSDPGVARSFAEIGGTPFEATIPRERVLSMYATGWGCRKEKEWIILGGGEATVYAVEQP